jgi:NAD(P)-dependent dehydrogenase (short-subunit alcohol dehydrogenase family)
MNFGVLLRRWRTVRRVSRLDLALDADISTRHLSCVETGRAQPSREMVLRLAEALQQFDAVIAVHLRAVLAGMKYAAPVMAAQGTASIINVASVNGFRAGLGGHYYSAAKAASIHLTRCAAMELGEKGTRVNSISPGMIATGAFGKYLDVPPDEADGHPEYAEAAITSVVRRWQPLQYAGRVDDIAQAALFLASDASRYVTGHNLVVDGGISAGWPIAAARPDREYSSAHFRRLVPRSLSSLRTGMTIPVATPTFRNQLLDRDNASWLPLEIATSAPDSLDG